MTNLLMLYSSFTDFHAISYLLTDLIQ